MNSLLQFTFQGGADNAPGAYLFLPGNPKLGAGMVTFRNFNHKVARYRRSSNYTGGTLCFSTRAQLAIAFQELPSLV